MPPSQVADTPAMSELERPHPETSVKTLSGAIRRASAPDERTMRAPGANEADAAASDGADSGENANSSVPPPVTDNSPPTVRTPSMRTLPDVASRLKNCGRSTFSATVPSPVPAIAPA